MIKYYHLIWIFLVGVAVFLYFSPDYKTPTWSDSSPEVPERDEDNGTLKTFYPDGSIKSQITYEEGIKHGAAYMYHSNGKVSLAMNYENGLRQGISKKYYKNGSLYAKTPYVDNEISGTRITYYENGKVKAKAPYHQSLHGLGLIEYTPTGTQIKNRTIQMVPELYNGNSILKFTIDNCQKEEFYVGHLVQNRYLDPASTLVDPLPSVNGFHFVRYKNLTEGDWVICACKTKGGNTYVTSKKIDMSVL